jgi:ABC-type uncharacterized transport system ATPase subunit
MRVVMMLLEYQAVTMPHQWPYDHGVGALDLQVAAGDLVVIIMPPTCVRSPLADLALGMAPPTTGKVLFAGTNWDDLSDSDAEKARFRWRRLFHGTAWLSNLDIWENLLLAAYYHTDVLESELLTEAEALAQTLGLPGLPNGRPALQPTMTLKLCQWLRVLLGCWSAPAMAWMRGHGNASCGILRCAANRALRHCGLPIP